MIITISGTAGSGKSTVAKLLAKKLNYRYISIGEIRRKIASDLGLDINEFNKLSEKETKYDTLVDEFQKSLRNSDNIVLDSRLGFYFIPNSVKIFIKVNPRVAAKRIIKANRKTEKYKSLEKAIDYIKQRDQSDVKRYRKLYGIDHLDESKYDLVIDSTDKTPEEIVDIIVNFLKTKD